MLEQLDNRRRSVVRVLVEMLAQYKGRVYDPCCGSAGIFVWLAGEAGQFAITDARDGGKVLVRQRDE